MRRLIPSPEGGPFELLLIGAHPDDLEIGCGATVLRWAREGRITGATWVVLSGDGPRVDEARRSAERFLAGVAECRVAIEDFRDGYFPYQGQGLKDSFERIKEMVTPDIVLTHDRDDRHQDHRLVGELAWQTFRDHLILEFEVPKFDGELSHPNVYVEITEQDAADKARLLMDGFPSQLDRQWFTAETFTGLARLRGIECRSATGLAEAFVGRKILVG